MNQPSRQEILIQSAVTFAGVAAFPRLARSLHWPMRHGRRGVVAYVALNTALGFVVQAWLLPVLNRVAEEQEQARAELRRELGREPTSKEVHERFRIGSRSASACGRRG